MVHHQRNKEIGDWEVMIMTAPLIIANPSTGSTFSQFNSSSAIEDGSECIPYMRIKIDERSFQYAYNSFFNYFIKI